MRFGRKRLLIVDAHPDVLIALQNLFEDIGFDTETVWTGGDAIRWLRRCRFHAALVSDYLPDSDCYTIVRQIARAGNIPVVIMQAATEEMNERKDLLVAGASAIVCKHDLSAVKKAICKVTRVSGNPARVLESSAPGDREGRVVSVRHRYENKRSAS